ncbi:Zn-dependent protease [Plasticicumulans lactativorans]|uniref:Zn-dependent protease n=1 Tax=Plasticicumulans lactativorans TaxID=1133106 RepID=A0A4R2LD16_9GAMM|nr:site-2 protease family protein [Plasticicumulans lactativorans]TCO83495.1 Zn-dependent protease [Plasticicumulans lactativorans]
MQELTDIQRLVVSILPLLFAITLHEVAHGWAALRFGDTTALQEGRLSLNPLHHIDPIGTVLVPLLTFGLPLLLTGQPGFLFGWAKPVPVSMHRLRRPRRDMAWVALAGPCANLAMALGWALVMAGGAYFAQFLPLAGAPLFYVGAAGILVNALFAVLNLFPIPPLDGSRVLAALLPPRAAAVLYRYEREGMILVLILAASGILGRLIWPLVDLVNRLFLTVVLLLLR